MEFTAKQEKGLQRLAKTLPAFFVLDYFRGLQRSRSYHTVEYLQQIAGQAAIGLEREDLVPAYGDVLEMVKRLDKLGLGTYVQGRKGHKTRVEWAEGTCLAEIGAKAIPDVEKLSAELELRADATTYHLRPGLEDVHLRSEAVNLSSVPVMEHQYQLRPGLYVDFAVPQDLTSLEARRLAAFVGTLSMES